MRIKTKNVSGFFLAIFLVAATLTISVKASGKSIWSELDSSNQLLNGGGLGLSSDLVSKARERIDAEKKILTGNTWHLSVLKSRAENYAPYILRQCREKGIPLEIALLPMVESSYDPFALSQDGAAGLWQIMPSTAVHLGVDINWWYDGRRDLGDSTAAALEYLVRLEQRFDNWLLALAAYNAGPARISRILKADRKRGGNGNYWELKLPRETARYVPRLLALREILIEQGQAAMLKQAPGQKAPKLQAVELEQQIDLLQVAQLADMDLNELYRINAGLNRWATPPDGPHRVWVPQELADNVARGLKIQNKNDSIRWRRYTVNAGDTLSEIASAKSSRTDWIVAANQLATPQIKENQALLIPYVKKPRSMSDEQLAALSRRIEQLGETIRGKRRVYHTVERGDSWWKLARRFDTTVAKLAEWNHRKPSDVLRVGEQITRWENIKAFQRDAVYRTIYHTVRSGDTLSKLAHRHKVSVRRIKDWNRLHDKRYIQPGQVLTLHVDMTR